MDSKKLKLPENTTVHSQSLKKIQGTFIQSIPNSEAIAGRDLHLISQHIPQVN